MSETSVIPFPDRFDATSLQDKGLAALLKLANSARESLQLDQARRAYEHILSFDPDNLDARIGLMRCHFYAENWPEAFKALEVRFQVMGDPPQVFVTDRKGNRRAKPRWTGGPAPGSLLVLDEQGMGDTLQFMRFLPRLISGGTRVTLVTHRRLFALIRAAGIACELRPMDQAGSVTGIEAWSPLLSLPMAMGLGAADIPMRRPYLAVDPARVARWRAWLGPAGLKVGV
ncbi:MAG TPA: tetratricopeptide repeat protein, partial [Beijerinckiaceae bacterium]|nr:tetratricopeptide repeat protein [Beijerinckiaceae bacterium]